MEWAILISFSSSHQPIVTRTICSATTVESSVVYDIPNNIRPALRCITYQIVNSGATENVKLHVCSGRLKYVVSFWYCSSSKYWYQARRHQAWSARSKSCGGPTVFIYAQFLPNWERMTTYFFPTSSKSWGGTYLTGHPSTYGLNI